MSDQPQKRLCPCCDQMSVRRLTPMTGDQAIAGFTRMLARGYTRERLLSERLEDLEFLAPGFAEWLRTSKVALAMDETYVGGEPLPE